MWSVLDGGAGPDQWIAPGIHFVNRVCYMLTEVRHDWADVQFRVHRDMNSLTAMGLQRRLSTPRKVLAMQSADSKEQLDSA